MISVQITKQFKFYAAHRNEQIGGKCASLHGHRYGVSVTVEEPMKSSVSILFEEIENKVNPIIESMDHSLLLNLNDPAAPMLVESGACDKVYLVPFVTSAENLATYLLRLIRDTGLNVIELALQETDTSTVKVKL
jgi:6-pyruvoyltetrahydropterin/6-carboxytetrahydropterin synthase